MLVLIASAGFISSLCIANLQRRMNKLEDRVNGKRVN